MSREFGMSLYEAWPETNATYKQATEHAFVQSRQGGHRYTATLACILLRPLPLRVFTVHSCSPRGRVADPAPLRCTVSKRSSPLEQPFAVAGDAAPASATPTVNARIALLGISSEEMLQCACLVDSFGCLVRLAGQHVDCCASETVVSNSRE